mmetsp:Transcript_8416/g.13849  ORF Transcript_8416/g.13849 Transcript_8416/m.13849 type:complete len:448 (-) Transcript_8416:290-1633(-)
MSNNEERAAPPPPSTANNNDDDSYEEECVICLEALSDTSSWGRCTPCQHSFHKSCWWQWENAHNERVDRSRRRGEIPPNERRPPKCCLCNAINEKFVDAQGQTVENPQPFVASEENNDEDGGTSFSFGSMSFNPENFTLENIQQVLRESGQGFGLPSELINDPNFVRQFSETVLNGGGGGRQGANPFEAGGAFQRGMEALNPSGMFQRIFGGGESSSFVGASAAAPNNSAQSNRNNNGVPPPYNQLPEGTLVVTQNLVNSPELNGRHGQTGRFDSTNGRYLVRLQPSSRSNPVNSTGSTSGTSETTVAMKPEKLLQMARVKVHGLQSQPQLNGSDGQIRSYSPERDRYVVRVAYIDQEVFRSLPPEMQLEVSLHPAETRDISVSCNNIHIPVGTCVRLEGLEQHVQWNGKYGKITKWIDGGDGGGGRYEVRLSRQYAVLAKPQNVRL